MSGTCQSCGKPEESHVWVTEADLTLWQPEPGFKKNSCARLLTKTHPAGEPSLMIFKIYRPPEDPCNEDFMEDISS